MYIAHRARTAFNADSRPSSAAILIGYFVLTISCTSAFISGVVANLSQTGFSASTKLLRLISEAGMIVAPRLDHGGARMSFSLASQSFT